MATSGVEKMIYLQKYPYIGMSVTGWNVMRSI